MTVAGQGPKGLVVLGCGAFGAAAADHLERRLKEPSIKIFKYPGGRRVLRKDAATYFTADDVLQAALRGNTGGAVALVAAVEESDGGGILIAALQRLAELLPHQPKVLWLLLPAPTASGLAVSRAYATLLELEHLRSQGAWSRCYLAEKCEPEMHTMFGDAILLFRHLAVSDSGGYKGFALALRRGWRRSLTEQLLPLVMRRLQTLGQAAASISAVNFDALEAQVQAEVRKLLDRGTPWR